MSCEVAAAAATDAAWIVTKLIAWRVFPLRYSLRTCVATAGRQIERAEVGVCKCEKISRRQVDEFVEGGKEAWRS